MKYLKMSPSVRNCASQYAYYTREETECARNLRGLHITPMKTAAAILAVLLATGGCGSEPREEFTPEEMELITVSAGMLARNIAYLPDSSGWSPSPGPEALQALEAMSEANTSLWPVFFRAAADTAAKLEQIMIQEMQEAQQSQLL